MPGHGRRRPFWWRRRPWQPAVRCGWCGWTPPDPPSGKVYGKHDPRFIGHAVACPTTLFADVRTEQDLADQAQAIALWYYATAHLGFPQAAETWRLLAWALVCRADLIGCRFPVPTDTRELRREVR